jgi:hypothetical protein
LSKPKGEFTWTNLETGENWSFPSMEALAAFLAVREGHALTGVPTPPTTQEPEEGWPEPAPLPSDYWETAE